MTLYPKAVHHWCTAFTFIRPIMPRLYLHCPIVDSVCTEVASIARDDFFGWQGRLVRCSQKKATANKREGFYCSAGFSKNIRTFRLKGADVLSKTS